MNVFEQTKQTQKTGNISLSSGCQRQILILIRMSLREKKGEPTWQTGRFLV